MFGRILLLAAALSAAPASLMAKLAIVTTTEDLASIARSIAGDKADVTSIVRGYQDPHFVDPKPSYLLRLRSADLLIAVGLDLEAGWLPALVQQCRNPKLLSTGYLDASQGCEILDRPTDQLTRAGGDVHPLGNPHYWLDPANGKTIAKNIAAKLGQLQPADAASFQARLQQFTVEIDRRAAVWMKRLAPYSGAKVATYHNSWPNLLRSLHIECIGYVEPKPGIPPSPSHTLGLIRTLKSTGTKIILVEPYFDLQTPNAIARDSGAKVVVLAPSVGGAEGIADYADLFDHIVALLEKSFAEAGYQAGGK